MSRIYRRVIQIWTCLVVLVPIKVYAAVASGGALPWDQPLNTLQTDLQGPVAHAVTTAAIIGTGLTWAFSEHGTGVRKMSSLAFGGAAALGATQLMTALFPLGGELYSKRWCQTDDLPSHYSESGRLTA